LSVDRSVNALFSNNIAEAWTVRHPQPEPLSFVTVAANYQMHAGAKRCTEFRNKLSPLAFPKD